jgi:hypothetical protein
MADGESRRNPVTSHTFLPCTADAIEKEEEREKEREREKECGEQ